MTARWTASSMDRDRWRWEGLNSTARAAASVSRQVDGSGNGASANAGTAGRVATATAMTAPPRMVRAARRVMVVSDMLIYSSATVAYPAPVANGRPAELSSPPAALVFTQWG